jgi:hypothetical protein
LVLERLPEEDSNSAQRRPAARCGIFSTPAVILSVTDGRAPVRIQMIEVGVFGILFLFHRFMNQKIEASGVGLAPHDRNELLLM